MAVWVVFDELIVTVRVPADLPAREVAALRQALRARVFRARLRRAVRAAVRADPALAGASIRVRISR